MNNSKRYIVIAKVGSDKFIKHHTSDLLKYSKYLKDNYPDFRYFNVFDKATGVQITSYTKYRLPASKHG
jgi:hypothetical protein